jgi:hypothetical protein
MSGNPTYRDLVAVDDISVGEVTPVRWTALMQTREVEIALSTFEIIKGRFPSLSMNLDSHHAYVDVMMDIPAQSGLCFNVNLNLQNIDELHLAASAFWCEWFPCTNPKKVERYIEAVSGVLSGEFRILEHWRGKRPVKALVQRPHGSGWKNFATWGDISVLVPWPKKTLKVVQNKR